MSKLRLEDISLAVLTGAVLYLLTQVSIPGLVALVVQLTTVVVWSALALRIMRIV